MMNLGIDCGILKTKKVIRNRNDVFCEDKTFADSKKDKEPQNIDIIPDSIIISSYHIILMFQMCR